MKDIKIKENYKKLKEIKEDSLKEFIYANREIPESWKNKLDYQNQVLEMFAKDRNFLTYLGNMGSENREITKSAKNILKTKLKLKCKKRPLSCSSKAGTNCLKEEFTLTTSKNNYSSVNIKNKLKNNKNKILDVKEINNIFEILHNDFPIKGKLREIFPEKLIKSINIKNKIIDNQNELNKKLQYPAIKPEKRRNIFRQNIFVNLVPSNPRKIAKRVQSAYMKVGFKNNNDEFVKKKFTIKDENIMKHLESINFFGPYYSYCPPCGNRNIDFYQNMDKKKLIQIVQQIKKIKGQSSFESLSERNNININKNMAQL